MTPTAYEPVTSTTDFGTTRDGLIQLRRRWQPTGDAVGAVLLLHGIAEHSGRYEHVGRRLADAGYEVIAVDHRGYGRSGGRRGHVDRWSQFSDDVEDHLGQVRALGLPTVLLGHSMGGLMATRYVVDERPPPDLLVLSGPALGGDRLASPGGRADPRTHGPHPRDPSGRRPCAAVERSFGGRGVLRRSVPGAVPDERLGAELMRAIEEARAGIAKVTMPTFVQHGSDDGLVPAAASEIFETLPNATRKVYDGLRHEIYNEAEGLAIVDEAIAWIDSAARRARLSGYSLSRRNCSDLGEEGLGVVVELLVDLHVAVPRLLEVGDETGGVVVLGHELVDLALVGGAAISRSVQYTDVPITSQTRSTRPARLG
ncbi:MAG: alpha/beta fold hydrolase [Acidimicrobiales bacterium]